MKLAIDAMSGEPVKCSSKIMVMSHFMSLANKKN